MLQTDNHTMETEQFAFYRVPKALFTNPQFTGLSIEAKVLYGLMLDRVSLSQRSGWLDEAGRVYIYFSVKDVQEQLDCGHCKASRHLKELETSGLIQRQRQWLGTPDRIYVQDFADCQNAENEASKSADASVEISENEQTDDSECDSALNSSTQTAENKRKEVPKRENPPVFSARMSQKKAAGYLKTSAPERSKTAANKTEYIKTEFSETESINPSSENFTAMVKTQVGGSDGSDGAKEKLKQVWGYPALLDSHSKETLDGIFTLGADVLQNTSPTIRVNRQELPAKTVKQRLLSLDFTHIDYVLDCLRRVSAPIRDMRRYLLTALYNAPATIDAYYDALFARNEAGREVMPALAH